MLPWKWKGRALTAEKRLNQMREEYQTLLRAVWDADLDAKPVNEAPDDGRWILILSDDGQREDGVWYGGDGRIYTVEAFPGLLMLMGASRWKPLPTNCNINI